MWAERAFHLGKAGHARAGLSHGKMAASEELTGPVVLYLMVVDREVHRQGAEYLLRIGRRECVSIAESVFVEGDSAVE